MTWCALKNLLRAMMRVGEQACFGSPSELGFVLKATTKLRVAVGVFHQFERLLDTINGLTAEGFSESDLVLLCDYHALEGCLIDAFGLDTPNATTSMRIIVRSDAPDTSADVVNPEDESWGTNLSADQILHFETWIEAHLADNLDHQLKRGGCLLLCPVLSPEVEQSVSNILLRHSAGPVQLHDVRPTT